MRRGVNVLVQTIEGLLEVDLETGEVDIGSGAIKTAAVETGLPRVVASAAAGSTVVAVVDTRPPMLVSHDAGRTWRESGRGLPPGFAVAVSETDPDLVVFAGRNRLYLSRDGGLFWHAVAGEFPDVLAVRLEDG